MAAPERGTLSLPQVRSGKQHLPSRTSLSRIPNCPQIRKRKEKCETQIECGVELSFLYLFSRTRLNIAHVNGKRCLSFSGEQVAPEVGELKECGLGRRERQPTEKKRGAEEEAELPSSLLTCSDAPDTQEGKEVEILSTKKTVFY